MAEAIGLVVNDRRQFDGGSLGQALGVRLLGSLHEQDLETIARGMAVDLRGALEELGEEGLRWSASTRAGALAVDLPTELSGWAPLHPSADRAVSDGDVTLVIEGLATVLAAHGYEPEVVFHDALASPLDVPGGLFLPASVLQVLFAYIDEEGLGPHSGQVVGELIGGGPSASALRQLEVYAEAGVPA